MTAPWGMYDGGGGTSIPLSAWAPRAVARPGNQRAVLFGVMLLYPVAYLLAAGLSIVLALAS